MLGGLVVIVFIKFITGIINSVSEKHVSYVQLVALFECKWRNVYPPVPFISRSKARSGLASSPSNYYTLSSSLQEFEHTSHSQPNPQPIHAFNPSPSRELLPHQASPSPSSSDHPITFLNLYLSLTVSVHFTCSL